MSSVKMPRGFVPLLINSETVLFSFRTDLLISILCLLTLNVGCLLPFDDQVKSIAKN